MFETIHACGLEGYYRVREMADDQGVPAASTGQAYAAFDSDAFLQVHTREVGEGLRSVDLLLEGVHCAACIWLVERLPRVATGVVSSRLSLRDGVMRVTWDPAVIALSQVARALERLGYAAHPARGASRRSVRLLDERKQLVRIGIAGACAGNAMLLALALYAGMFQGMEEEHAHFFRWLSMGIGLVALAWPGSVFFRGAWAAMRAHTVSLDVPIALALAVGGVAGAINTMLGIGDIYFDSLSVLVFLLLVGRYLQSRQQRWATDSVELMLSLTPVTCRIVRGDAVVDAPIEALIGGDIAEVRSGDLFPADGVLLNGRSTANRALLTGEAAAAPIRPGDTVYAGTQNVGSVVRMRVDATGEATRVGRLMRLVERGVENKPATVQFADRIAGPFLLAVVLIAAAVFAAWSWRADVGSAVTHTVALLIVTCPCALGLATPLTFAVATGRAARRDILIKDAASLEKLARRGRLLLDKTGTLTRGRATLLQWTGPQWLRPVVAEVERHSSHPVARALVEALEHEPFHDADRAQLMPEILERGDGGIEATFQSRPLFIGSATYMQARGVCVPDDLGSIADEHRSAGHGVVFIAWGGQVLALAVLGDSLHQHARASLSELRHLGWHPSILSGDDPRIVERVATDAGIPHRDAVGGVDPESKLEHVRLATQTGLTVMVGDGVNDAAALAAADVGIAVHGGAEASLAAADIYIARPGVDAIVELVRLARRTVYVARRNFAVSLGYNIAAIALAAGGWLNPLVAAVLMPVSSVTVLTLAVGFFGKAKGTPACP